MNTTAAVATIPPRPTRGDFQPLEKVKTAKDLMAHPDMLARMKAAVPQHVNPQRMLRVFALAMSKTPDIAKADIRSLIGAMMVCASLGLEPNTPLGHAYLIPFAKRKKNEATGHWETASTDLQLIIGYKGFIDLARRSGNLTSVHADVVYEGDDFSFEYGTDMHLRHVPRGSREGRRPDWAYAVAKLTDGFAFEVLPYAEVLKIRDKSQGYQQVLRNRDRDKRGKDVFDASPWVAHEHEMASKTMIRRLAKVLPLSIDFANAAQLDSMSDEGRANLGALADMTGDALQDGMGHALVEDQSGEHIDVTPTVDAGAAQPQPAQQRAEPKPEAPPEPQREAADPAAMPVEALIGGCESCTTTDELTAFWRDCEESRSLLSPADRAKLNIRKAEIEVNLLNKEGKKR